MGENVKRTTDLCVKEPATATTFFLKLFQTDRQTDNEGKAAGQRVISHRKLGQQGHDRWQGRKSSLGDAPTR